MPCYDSRDDINLPAERERWMHDSPVAAMLCWAMTLIERAEVPHVLTNEGKAAHLWFEEHKARDKLRKQFKEWFV